MIVIVSPFLIRVLAFYSKTVVAKSFFIFIIFKDKEAAADQATIQHERIHFYQQLELLFVFQWLLYAVFYIVDRNLGASHLEAYKSNPFEMEAHENEGKSDYLKNRKLYNWTKYI